jgi:hypothetical protein
MPVLSTRAALAGNMWPRWFALNSIDWVTRAECALPDEGVPPSVPDDGAAGGRLLQDATSGGFSCATTAGKAACAAAGGVCSTSQDGFLIMVLVSSAVAMGWWVAMRRRVKALEAAPRAAWLAAPC